MNRKFIGTMLIVLLMMPLLAACATQSGWSEMDDATLEASVRAKIAEVNTGPAADLGVSVDKGNITLSGEVATADLRNQIGAAVREVKGVRSVINNLTVK